jgi:hypothetical protein
VETSVTTPTGGLVAITSGPAGPAPSGFTVLGTEVSITAPDATAADPLVIVFTIDASVIPPGTAVSSMAVFKNGVLVPDCTSASGVASPDPCVASRTTLPNGDVQIEVLSSTASDWMFAVPEVTCRGLAATIIGDDGANVLNGTSGDDVIWAGEGNDTVNGMGGNDTICLGPGDDTADGGDGNDLIQGGSGSDVIYGGAGADVLKGRSGADYLYGQGGNDTLLGQGGNDTLEGQGGNDTLRGARGNDVLKGAKGDDYLYGGAGTDTGYGGAGTNYCFSTELGAC